MSSETLVKDILSQKQNKQIQSIEPTESVFDALKQMALYNVGALLVMEHGKVTGIISERDYARKVVLKNRSSRTTKVCEIMESKVLYVTPNDTAKGCMALMTEKFIRHLPVFDDNQLLGIISIGDIVRAVIDDHEFMIDQLMSYTTGSYTGRSELQHVMAEIRVL